MNKKQEIIIKRNASLDRRVSKHWVEERKLRAKMIVAIHDMVSEMGGIETNWEEDDCYPTIIYDGGRHPEYNSTISSVVNGVNATFTQTGKKSFSVNLEEEENYSEDRMEFSDVDQVYNYVCYKYEDWLSESNEKEA